MYNEPPAPVVVEKGGGCDAGFGAGAALAVLAACLAARKSVR
ncbi:MAG: SYNERG-CTERM sorting domain-containing protein [Synergistaceae bacterium]|nr:SYNERG-CTERM sorting domain-containing protein [Synergistaceae bacterium]